MKARSKHFLISISLALLILTPTAAQEQKASSRILITPMVNTTKDPNLELLEDTVTDVLTFTLNLLGTYTVIADQQPIVSPTNDALQNLARINMADYVLFGKVFKTDSGETALTLSVYDRLDSEIVVTQTEKSKTMLGTFDAVDRLLIATLEKFSGIHIGWGSILLVNEGVSGFYDIYIDDFFVGSNKSLVENVLSGEREIVIRQERPYNDFLLFEDTITVPENKTVSLTFAVPGMLDIEESGFSILKDSIQNSIRTNDKTIEQKFKLAFELLEKSNASEELISLKQEFESLRHEYNKRKENGEFYETETPDDEAQQKELVFSVDSTYGNAAFSTETAGTLYMNSKKQGEIQAGASATMKNLETGTYRFEMRYEDGERETKQVKIEHNRTANVAFTYRKEYKIGEPGPAGGLVFYDKGEYSAGWRYLEAAPASTEWKNTEWGAYRVETGASGTAAGAGKANTNGIAVRLNDRGETGKAAWLCDTLISGGYDDWFLPSLESLSLMVENLHDEELGDFTDTFYWSSTEYSPHSAWKLHFDSARKYYSEKDERYHVRAIRAF